MPKEEISKVLAKLQENIPINAIAEEPYQRPSRQVICFLILPALGASWQAVK